MTDLEYYQPNNRAVHAYVPSVTSSSIPDAVATLRAWASTYAEVASFVAPLVDTPFVPATFRPQVNPRDTPEEVRAARDIAVATATAAVIYGAAIGFDPMTALQNVYVINGRPALYADAQVAIVQAAGHEVWTEEVTDSRAIVCGRRAGSTAVERVSVTMDAAKRAGWTRNAKYGTDPQAMLYARAASRVCRRIAQDALKGLGSSVEELQDGDESAVVPGVQTVTRAALPARADAVDDPEPAAKARPRKRTAAPRAAAAGLPPLPGEDEAESRVGAGPQAGRESAGNDGSNPSPAQPPLPGETGEFASAEQFAAITAGFRDLDITGPARGEYVAKVLGHPVADPAAMTAAQAAAVIDSLNGPPEDDGGQETLDVDDPPDEPS